MTQEEKELVIKDLCGRLPYGVMCKRGARARKVVYVKPYQLYAIGLDNGEYISQEYTVEDVKPYLRPMSSMTEKERNELRQLMNCDAVTDCSLEYAVGGCVDYDDFLVYYEDSSKLTDWLNKNMFDYRELIPKGLALEAPEGMYKI